MTTPIIDSVKKLQQNSKTKFEAPSEDACKVLESVEKQYKRKLPLEIVDFYSVVGGGFIARGKHDSWRILSPQNLLDAEKDLNVSFQSIGLLPLIDCMDNVYLCYNFNAEQLVLFNIVDEIGFDNYATLADFLGNT